MESETISSSDLCDFVKQYSLPQCVCVTDGNFLSRAVQISRGDVLLLKSYDNGQVTLSYRNEISHSWIETNISIDSQQKFKVLLPKDVNYDEKTASMIMYPTVADLLLDCPTFFEATASYDDPYLPGMSVKAGDRFCFAGMVKNCKDGVNRLKVKDIIGNTLVLSPDCRGNFCPLEDENEYTIKELIDLSPVQRRLKMVNKGLTRESKGNIINNKTGSECEISQIGSVVQSDWIVSAPPVYMHQANAGLESLPPSYSGIIHLLKPESKVVLSPYNDPETIWTIPVSASLRVRIYSPSDYEVPVPRFQKLKSHIPLPFQDDVPKFVAPSAPLSSQHIAPADIKQFVDTYCSSFPVKARVVDTSSANPFFQSLLQNTEEIDVYRLEEMKRLYVKDAKTDDVYSLSHEARLSFVEYPEKFKMISELLHLQVGSEVTVLEDIATDFPKPFSLRFGDVIRILSNTVYIVKTKLVNQNCHVMKCERIDPEGGENMKLKLPLDLEVSMIKKTDQNGGRMIKLQDILSGMVPIPIQNVASVPDDSESLTLKELPVNLRILKPLKEVVIVVSALSSAITIENKSTSERLHEKTSPVIIGLPLTCGIVLAFKDKMELFEIDSESSQTDCQVLPVEKITVAEFAERERLLKVNPDYEDVECSSSNAVDVYGTGNIVFSRTDSSGFHLERKQKSTKMDKVRRLSRALNPKHWRHTKPEPEPLPHPSAIGLTTSMSQHTADSNNEYHQDEVDSVSIRSESLHSGSTATDVSTESVEEDENFYEDVEIGPIKSSAKATTISSSSAFSLSAATYNTLPAQPLSPIPHPRKMDKQANRNLPGSTQDALTVVDKPDSSKPVSKNTSGDEVPMPLIRAKHWATNIGNNITSKLSTKPRDVASRPKIKHSSSGRENEAAAAKTEDDVTYHYPKPPESRPPLPPPKTNKKFADSDICNDKIPSVSQYIQMEENSCPSDKNETDDQNVNVDKELTNQHESLTSADVGCSISSNTICSEPPNSISAEPPRPKPRGQKKLVCNEQTITSPQPSIRQKQPRSDFHTENLGSLLVDSHSSAANHEAPQLITVKDNFRPVPPPKPKLATQTIV